MPRYVTLQASHGPDLMLQLNESKYSNYHLITILSHSGLNVAYLEKDRIAPEEHFAPIKEEINESEKPFAKKMRLAKLAKEKK